MLGKRLNMLSEQHTKNGGPAEYCRTTDRLAAALTSRHDDAGDGDAFGELVQQDSQEEQNAQSTGDQKAAGDRDTIEEGVQGEPKEGRPPGRWAEVMGLLTKMKMRCEHMLGEVDGKVPNKDIQRRIRRVV
jgi:hypothetical protein